LFNLTSYLTIIINLSMSIVKNAVLLILLVCVLSCKKDEKTNITDAPPFATAGTNQDEIEQFQVTLNADSLLAGQKGKWTIETGLIENKVFFSDPEKPDSRFNGMPGEIYQLKWTVTTAAKVYSESSVKITFKPLKAIITNNSPNNSTQFFLLGNSYDKGLWTIEGKYASLQSLQNGGTVIPEINSPGVKLQGYAYTSYKITWTTYYGSKSASATLLINSGDYLEREAIRDLQLDSSSYRIGYDKGHVVKLNLQASGIAGMLKDTVRSPTMQAFKHLKWLNLSGSATFEFPAIICDQFLELEYLDVSHTKLTSLPYNIGNLKHLKKLIMGYDGRISELPESFGELESLEYFKATFVGLNYIPESFSKLKNLKYFECTLNPLQGLPSKIGDLSNLQVLMVNTAGALPSSISKLSKLRKLNFQSTVSNNVLPADVGNMIALDTLMLDANFKELPDSFGNLRLRQFQIYGPALTKIPETFGHMKNLEDLVIYGSFKTLPESFARLPKLKFFTAGSYSFERLPLNIGDLTTVSYMSIAYGKFKTLPESIGKMERLKELYLDRSEIESLPDGLFNLPSIAHLDISNFKQNFISKDFSKLSGTLKNLNWINNNLSADDKKLLQQLLPTTIIRL